MNNSLKLLAVRGIDIRLHITFPLILLWGGVQFGLLGGSLSSALFGVVAITILFVLVTLHELGHSFAALSYGVPVKQIVLSPIGGVAQLSHMPDKPRQELVIAAAGPAVNLGIAVIMGVLVWVFGIPLSNPLSVLAGAAGFSLTALFSYIFIYNIFLAVFNLIPAFPMDGGRIFRALLALRLDYGQATRIAASVGRVVAVLLGLYGLFNGGIFLVIIAFFIYTTAGQEAQVVTLRQTLRHYRVRQAFSALVYRITPYNSLEQALNMMMSSGQSVLPVTMQDRLMGMVYRPELLTALRSYGSHTWVERIMKPVEPVTPDMDLFSVFQRMQAEGVEALPVVEFGRFQGVISRRNISQIFQIRPSLPDMPSQVRSEPV